jgi:hypothetical protein
MCFPGFADLAAARALLPRDATPLVVVTPVRSIPVVVGRAHISPTWSAGACGVAR